MGKRPTPATPATADAAASTPAATTSRKVGTPANDPTADALSILTLTLAATADAPIDDVAVAAIVRPWNDGRRNRATLALSAMFTTRPTDAAAIVAAIGAINTAPTGADPTENVAALVVDSAMALVALVTSVRQSHPRALPADDGPVGSALVALVAALVPTESALVAAAEKVTRTADGKGERTRTDRSAGRDVARLYGVALVTPKGARVTVAAGPDGAVWRSGKTVESNPSAIVCAADGVKSSNGWQDLKNADGVTADALSRATD